MKKPFSDFDLGQLLEKVDNIEKAVARLEQRQINDFVTKDQLELRVKPMEQDVKRMVIIVGTVISTILLAVLGTVLYSIGLKQ